MSHGLLPGLALLAWIPFTFWLVRAYPLPKAAIYSVVGGILILPNRAAFDLPLLPDVDKEFIPPVAFLAAAFFIKRRAFKSARLGKGDERLFALMVFGAIGTWLFNPNPIFISGWEPKVLPAMTLRDSAALMVRDFFAFIVPFCAARIAVQNLSDFRQAIRSTIFLGLLYAPLVLVEVRMSPQVHNWMWGYAAQASFLQAIRFGGYRPVLLFPHGLGLAMFLLAILFMLAGLYKGRKRLFGLQVRWFFFFYAIVLVLEKSTGAIVYAVLILPLLFFASKSLKRWTIYTLAVFGLSYPLLVDVLPRHELADWIANYSEERAQSLQFRFDNEDILVERAREKYWVGWGAYSRNRIFDPVSGQDITVTDGAWIIRFGELGMIGMSFTFLLFIVPSFRLMRRLRQLRLGQDEHLIFGVAFYVGLYSFEMVPNGILSYYFPFFLAGAVSGLADHLQALSAPYRERPQHVQL